MLNPSMNTKNDENAKAKVVIVKCKGHSWKFANHKNAPMCDRYIAQLTFEMNRKILHDRKELTKYPKPKSHETTLIGGFIFQKKF